MSDDPVWDRRRARALRILTRLKVPHEETDEFDMGNRPSWDGESFGFSHRHTAFDILHEACHWLIAPKAHHAWDNFGLGRDPWSGPARLRLSHDEAHEWEISACVLDVVLARHLCWNWHSRVKDVSMDEGGPIRTIGALLLSVKPEELDPALRFVRNDGDLRADFARKIDSTLHEVP